ncbi:hypothetical protein H0H81_005340, partial [Sphagnurus paluster]
MSHSGLSPCPTTKAVHAPLRTRWPSAKAPKQKSGHKGDLVVRVKCRLITILTSRSGSSHSLSNVAKALAQWRAKLEPDVATRYTRPRNGG